MLLVRAFDLSYAIFGNQQTSALLSAEHSSTIYQLLADECRQKGVA